jgi:hypothetical protein
MNKLTCSAIALSMTCATGFASDGDWSALDQEVGALASTLSLDGGPTLSGLLQTQYATEKGVYNTDAVDATDPDGTPGTGDETDAIPAYEGDEGGWATGRARLAVDGSHGDYGYHVDYDFAGEGLRGAYATWAMTESVSAQMGQFRASVSNDADLDEGSMKHFRHSLIGGAFTNHTSGLGLSGAMSDISWALSIMNGDDGTQDELATAIRVSMNLMDGGEGGISVSASAAKVEDVADDTGAMVIEVNAGNGTWNLGVETAKVDDMGSGSFGENLDGEAPMVISLSYDFGNNWELCVRQTNNDNGSDAVAATDPDGTPGTGDETAAIASIASDEGLEITANHYLDGHGLKWQFGVAQPEVGEDRMMVGLTVSF